MLHKMFDTEDLSAPERADTWNDFVADLMLPNSFQIDRGIDFNGSLRAADLGVAHVVAPIHSPLRCWRTAGMIRRSDPELYMVGLVLKGGQQGIAQSRREAAVGAGDLVLYSSSEPYEAWSHADDGMAGSVVAHVHREALPLPRGSVDGLLASRFSGQEGAGALLAHFLGHLNGDTGTYRPTDAARLGVVLLDLITALLAHALEDTAHVPPESKERTLMLRIKAFIERHLADPDLSVATIAAAHHVSSRHVQRLFQRQGSSVAAYIRHQRLERVRRDLAEPALSHLTIHAIAARRGFVRPEVFTRTFRSAYGIPPRDYRDRFRHGPGEERR